MARSILESTAESRKGYLKMQDQTPLKTVNRIMGEFNSSQEDWRQAKRIYDTFKKLRASMGRPLDDKINPKKARRDLFNSDFFRTS